MTEKIATLLIVVLALIFVVRELRRAFRSKGGCSACDGCGQHKPAEQRLNK